MPERLTYMVIAPPPTPNGDLHVGHLSGPYLGADVFSRFQKLQGNGIISAVSTDEHQSYVVTTAERLGVDPVQLAGTNYQDIRSTLQQADIHFDVVGRPDDDYARFVVEFFTTLHTAGVFVEKDVQTYYDPQKERYLFESYIGGLCPICFNGTKGNICEGCGHPNDPFTLVHAYAVGQQEISKLEVKTIRGLFLPLEQYRPRIEHYYAENYERLRPTLRALIKTLLQAPLPDFPITYISDWGIRVPFPGYESTVYNVWAEMYPGHLYWIQSAYNKQSGAGATSTTRLSMGSTTRFAQFLGFDNSFFYTVAHLALAMAAIDAGISVVLPSHFITNEFYLLDNYKFSTSQGHLIWGKDLLAEYNIDPVRFYLCFSNPETQQTNFSVNEMTQLLEGHLLSPFERLRQNVNALIEQGRDVGGSSPTWADWITAFQHRFELALNPDTFSLRQAAATLESYIKFVADEAQRALDSAEDPQSSLGLGTALTALVLFTAPLMPSFSQRLADHWGIRAGLLWDQLPNITAKQYSTIPAGILSLPRGA